MALIHHIVRGHGRPPIVFVHGFACGLADWDAQVAHFSRSHQTVAVDLRGHGASPGMAEECSIEQYGADVAEVMRTLELAPAVLVGHSMGCRVVVEAALQALDRTAAVVLIDGSQFAPAMDAALKQSIATPGGLQAVTRRWFEDMFTAKSNAAIAASVIDRAVGLPSPVGEKVVIDLVRYDVGRLALSLAGLPVPVMALQCTYSNDKRERQTMSTGQTTPYLDLLRSRIPSVRIEIIPDTGHFPQIDEAGQTNALLDSFLATLPA